MPPHGARAARVAMKRPGPPLRVEIQYRAAEDADLAHVGELALEAIPESDVVRVETSQVPPLRTVQSEIERGREAELLGVSERHEPWIVERLEPCRGLVGRRVVDHDQLEVRHRLPQHALDGGGD